MMAPGMNENDFNCRKQFLIDNPRICVWGLGHIGLSTLHAFDAKGLATVGCDTSDRRVKWVASSQKFISGPYLTSSRNEALSSECNVHFIAVPTEQNGEPSTKALFDVCRWIGEWVAEGRKPGGENEPILLIIESTITPGTTSNGLIPIFETLKIDIGCEILIALSPRRDWFLTEGYTLAELDRIYCGVDEESTRAAGQVLSLICQNLHAASNHHVGEMVKVVENSFRHVEITLGNQLSLAYPDVDISEVLKLAGTKWNMGLFHPSFGTGGYCIPVSSKYVLEGTSLGNELSILSSTISTDEKLPKLVANSVKQEDKVLILGLAYKGDIKVATLSPTISISKSLFERGVAHSVYDPLYTKTEIDGILGHNSGITELSPCILSATVILVVSDHDIFKSQEFISLLTESRKMGLTIIDNTGFMSDISWPKEIRYFQAGSKSWLERSETSYG